MQMYVRFWDEMISRKGFRLFGAFWKKKSRLVSKAKKGILQEAAETKEFARLLYRRIKGHELTDSEVEATKAQAADLAKLLPLIAILLLPGGSFVVIILERLTPFTLLPSAFQDRGDVDGWTQD